MKASNFNRSRPHDPPDTTRCLCGQLIAKGHTTLDHTATCPAVVEAARQRGYKPEDFSSFVVMQRNHRIDEDQELKRADARRIKKAEVQDVIAI